MSTDRSPTSTVPDAALDSVDPEDLVVIVAPEEVCADLDADVACWRARHENARPTDGSDVAQLTSEIERLEAELDRARRRARDLLP